MEDRSSRSPRSQASGPQNLIAPSTTTSSKVRSDTLRVSLAPGPPASALTVNGTLFQAPKPVTVAIPVNIARGPLISAETILPVTYMAMVSNFPLPGWPAGSLATSAKHSNLPSPIRTAVSHRSWGATSAIFSGNSFTSCQAQLPSRQAGVLTSLRASFASRSKPVLLRRRHRSD